MNVIELAKECGANIFAEDMPAHTTALFELDQLQAFAEAIKRDLLDVGMEPVAYGERFGTNWQSCWCIPDTGVPPWMAGTTPLFTAEQMAHSRSEAVREAVSRQKEKDAKICDYLSVHGTSSHYSYQIRAIDCAEAIRNQSEGE